MEKYYCNGKEITKTEAEKIKTDNIEIMKSDDISAWENIKFITVTR